MQPIQLPTSTDQLGDALLRHMRFVSELDVEKERKEAFPHSLEDQFYSTFDKKAELKRLFKLGMALMDGVKTLQFA